MRTNKRIATNGREPEMLAEYDFSGAERGKYAKRFGSGANVVVLTGEVAKYFPDSEAVNSALMSLVAIARKRETRVRPKAKRQIPTKRP